MKNNLKKIKQLLFLFTTILIISCSKDNFEEDRLIPENSQNKRTIKEYNFNEANKQPKFFIGYSKIKKGISEFSTNSTSKVVPRDVNFTIDTTTIKEITNGNIRTYTMLISRPEFTTTYFENLVIKVDEQDSIIAYIVTYFPEKNSEYHQEHDSYTFNGTSSIREIEYDPAFFNIDTVEPFECHMVYYCNWGGQQHVAGDNCSNIYGLLDCSGGGGGGTGSGGEGSSEGGGGSGSNGTGSSGSGTSGITTTTPVITDTAPVIPYRNINLVTTLSLDPTQATWINSVTNAAVKRALQEYMYYNPTNVSFGVWTIDYLMQNLTVTLTQFQNWFMTPREGLEDISSLVLENMNLTFPPQVLPTFDNFLLAFPSHLDINFSTSQQVYTAVGGAVLTKYNQGARNTCALRVSKGLNYSGIIIPNIPGVTVKGADNKNYFLVAKNLLHWMKSTFGTPTGSNHLTGAQGGTNGENFPTLLQGKEGVYIMMPNDSSLFEATGHADMFFDGDCDGSCYFSASGGVSEIFFWVLP